MMRMTLWLRRSLPFEPMALSTLDTLEERLRAVGVKQSEQRCAYETRSYKAALQDDYHVTSDAMEDMAGRTQWCTGQTPFFVSPKLDGVRLITYNTPSLSIKSTDNASQWTCYTRYGRALYGMFWLEEELRLLRALCGDPALVLDGELYLHRPPTDHNTHSKSEWNDEAAHEGGDAFKTGFLAVSALVNRMRGSSSQCATVEDILQYVRALPQYYVFDVASYQPAEHLRDALQAMTEGRRHTSGSAGALQRRHTSLRPALSTLFARTFTNSTHTSMSGCTLHDGQDALRCEAELQRVRMAALRRCHVDCVDTLRVLPNMTPFSARLRTMHFLYTLLQLGRRSPLLRRGFLTQGAPKKLSRPGCDMALRNAIAPARGDKGYVHMVPYRLAHNLPDAQQRHLTQYIQNGFEGAVIRSPGNVYEMREKKQDTVRHLVQPLHVGGEQTTSTAVMQSVPIVRLYAHGQTVARSSKREGRTGRRHTHAAPSAIAEEEEEEDEQRIAQAAVSHARTLPRRCENAVKLLPYRDQEYAILRPLLKEPSRNPRTRQLVLIPRSRLMRERGVTHKILRTAASKPRNEEEEKCTTTTSAAKKASDVVAFYGLHCLAENGRSFCVSLPKMSLERQRALLEHLLSVARKRQGRRGKGSSPASLTGLYATVKFAALTEHGVPRFGTVKAIRGGKGWFL